MAGFMIVCSCYKLSEKQLLSIPYEDLVQGVICGKCIDERLDINDNLSPPFTPPHRY